MLHYKRPGVPQFLIPDHKSRAYSPAAIPARGVSTRDRIRAMINVIRIVVMDWLNG